LNEKIRTWIHVRQGGEILQEEICEMEKEIEGQEEQSEFLEDIEFLEKPEKFGFDGLGDVKSEATTQDTTTLVQDEEREKYL